MKILGDKPLIQYSIDFALNNFSKDAIWVNSDDQEIIEFSKEKGIKTLERPDCLATDFASTADVFDGSIVRILSSCLPMSSVHSQRHPSSLRANMKKFTLLA